MNKEPKISRQEQHRFVREENIRFLHFAVRACPCDGVGCQQCGGKMKYYDEPVPLYGAITNGSNKKKKEAQFPTVNMSNYTLLVEPRFRIAKGDRITPFAMREFEQADEILPVEQSLLTYIPINPRGVSISFVTQDGVINYKYPDDFTIERELYGRVPLFSKQIIWVTDPSTGQDKFSVRYGYLPDFEIDEIPEANLSQGQLLMQQLKLKKITVGGQTKTDSFEQSSDAVRGIKYD